jgi:membrane protease YdiL (CAAX protease family)
MNRQNPTGFQIVFFIFALSIVCIPLSRGLLSALGPGWEELQIFRLVFFSAAALLIVSFPRVRRSAADFFRQRIPDRFKAEVAWVAVTNAFFPLAAAGAFALYVLWQSGDAGVERLISIQMPGAQQMDRTFSRSGIFVFFAAVFVAPIIEELVFRGFLFKAWERRWGWILAAVLSSAVFAVYHRHFVASFIAGLIHVAVFRRTGALSAAIIVHAVHNLCLSYPLLGQFMFPTRIGSSFVETWWIQLSALALAVIAIPYYLVKAHRFPANEQPSQSAFSA